MTTHYEVEGRNGYFAVDEYDGTTCKGHRFSSPSRAIAQEVADAFNEGYARGQADTTATLRGEVLRGAIATIEAWVTEMQPMLDEGTEAWGDLVDAIVSSLNDEVAEA